MADTPATPKPSAKPVNPAPGASKTTRVGDPELQSLEKIGKLLLDFDETVRMRMIGYINSKFYPAAKMPNRPEEK